MEDKTSIIKFLGLPESFAVVLLTFSFILFLTLFFSGVDFGLFKIPKFADSKRKKTGIIGTVVFCLMLMSILPVIPKRSDTEGNQTDPNKVNILVADFDGPNSQNYRVTEKIIQQLRAATSKYSDIRIQALGQTVTEQQGSEVARAIGIKRKASIILWGWYASNQEAVDISVYFEVLQKPEILYLRKNLETQTSPISELNGFKIQTRLSGEMTYMTLLTVGLARYESGDYDGAIDRFTTALAQSGVPDQIIDPADIYFYRGLAYYDKAGANGIDQAIADYDKAIGIKPDFAEAYINRGNFYSEKGQYDRAIADYDEAIKIMPNDAEAYYNCGLAYSHKDQHDRAIVNYDKAIGIKPDFADAYNDRGLAYKRKGQYDRAIADYDEAIKIMPNDAQAYVNRGSAYSNKGEHDLAIVDFNKAIKIKPDDAEVYYNRGTVYSVKAQHDLAIADFNKAIKIKPDFAEAYINRGSAYSQKGERDRAIADYNKALEIIPDHAIAYNNRGNVYQAKGQYDRAIADYYESIKIKPDDAEVYYNRAVAYRSKKESDRAISDLKTILQISNDPNLRQRAEKMIQELDVK